MFQFEHWVPAFSEPRPKSSIPNTWWRIFTHKVSDFWIDDHSSGGQFTLEEMLLTNEDFKFWRQLQ